MKIYNIIVILYYTILYYIYIFYYLKYFIIEYLVSTVRIESWTSSFLLGQPSILTVEPKHSVIVANESTLHYNSQLQKSLYNLFHSHIIEHNLTTVLALVILYR